MKKQSTLEASATPVLESVLSPDEAAFSSQDNLNNYRCYKALLEKYVILHNRKIMLDAFFEDADISPSTVTVSIGTHSFTLIDSRASNDVVEILMNWNERSISNVELEISNLIF